MIIEPLRPRRADEPQSGTIVVYEASTIYGVATLAAAIDAGLWADSGRRILLLANNGPVPETTPALADTEGFEQLARRFTEVWSFNDLVHPHHPAVWNPRTHEYPVLTRYLTLALGLEAEGPDQLVVESVHVSPAKLLCALFGGAGIDVYSEGLMSYGPTRQQLPALTGRRIERLIYPDLVSGLTPLLLGEWQPETCSVPVSALRAIFDELAEHLTAPELPQGPIALVLGQYLSALGLMSIAEETELYASVIVALAATGHSTVVFKPHPNAPAAMEPELLRVAEGHGVTFTVLREQMLSEVLLCLIDVDVVAGSFSTGLITAARLFDIPAYRTQCRELATRLRPLQNSNRFPLTLVDSILPSIDEIDQSSRPPMAPADLRLLTAVAHAMQPERITAPGDIDEAEWGSRVAPYLPAGTAPPSALPAHAVPHTSLRRLAAPARVRGARNKVVKAAAWRLRKGVTRVEKRLTR